LFFKGNEECLMAVVSLYELHAQYHQKSYAVCLIHIVCIFALAIDVFSQSDVGRY
jgi:hypothetical protein